MRLPTSEFIRRFLIHVLPSGFHRIRHAGFLANGIRRDRIKTIRQLLDAGPEQDQGVGADPDHQNASQVCPKCGGAMIVIETFARGETPRAVPRHGKTPHDQTTTHGAELSGCRPVRCGQPPKTCGQNRPTQAEIEINRRHRAVRTNSPHLKWT